MRWSWRIGRLAGIGISVHVTFLLILAWIAFQEYAYGARAIAGGMLYIFALFAIVVLHELGHALMARRHMELYGTTADQLGTVAKTFREVYAVPVSVRRVRAHSA